MMMPPKLVLVPIDFSASSQEALEVATDMASRLGSDLLLVHIVPAIPDLPKDVSIFKEGEYDSELHRIASKQLSDLATTLEDKNLNVRTEVGTQTTWAWNW
jgi:nucleotide-binding universal stress UspA family protein